MRTAKWAAQAAEQPGVREEVDVRRGMTADWSDRQWLRPRAGLFAQGLSCQLGRTTLSEPLRRLELYKAFNGSRALNERQMRKALSRKELGLLNAAGQRDGAAKGAQR